MFWPLSFPGKVLLLSPQGSFNAQYIRRMIQLCGVTVISAADAPNQVLADLPGDDLAAVVACLAVDLEPEVFRDLGIERWPFPFLFVGPYPGSAYPDSFSWIQAPFASYQVMEALFNLTTPSWGLSEP